MKKAKLTKVLALTLVFIMIMSTAAYAAVPGKVISNQLKGTFVVNEMKNYNVVAQDFGVMDLSGVKGYNVGFKLENATISEVTAMEVSILKDDTVLMTTTAEMTDWMSQYPDASQLSSPFDVFGGMTYGNLWESTGWNPNISELTVPNKAVIKVTFENNDVKTATNTNCTGDPNTIIPTELINLTWNADTEYTKDSTGAYIINVDQTKKFNITVTADSKYMIDKTLFIIECDKQFTAIASDGQSLGVGAGYWFWGPETGFTFKRDIVSTTFTVTAEPGTYVVNIYAVQLP